MGVVRPVAGLPTLLDESEIDSGPCDVTDSDDDESLYSLAEGNVFEDEDLEETGASSNNPNVVISKDGRTWNIVNNSTNVTSGLVE